MAEFPALPLWTDAYLGDTRHLSTLEHGAYLLLLMTAWRSTDPTLPDDDKLLARYCGLGARQWATVRPILAEFYTIENGRWKQRRLSDERKRLSVAKENAIAAGKASALKRLGRHSTDVQRSVNDEATIPHPHPHPHPQKEEEEERAGAQASDLPLPELFETQEVEIDQAEVIRCAWNIMAAQCGLGKWNRFTDSRKAKVRARLEDYTMAECVEAISRIPDIPFLTGENQRKWKADFDFFARPDSITKILEGKYTNGNAQSASHPYIDLLKRSRAIIEQYGEYQGRVGEDEAIF